MALKGQTDRAINLYQQVTTLEPSAMNHRQRLAELLSKAGRNDEARVELDAIGKNYSSNGFYLKAIAVYKKLQTLFPGDVDITLSLADLNQKHGLTGNALAEYETACRHYQKSASSEVVGILEKMHELDPQNSAIRLRLAEAYVENG